MRREPRALTLIQTLLALGYTKIRWRPAARGSFLAFDEQRICSLIVVDVAPVRNGFPTPRLSPARVSSIREQCRTYLQDNVRVRKVRADYIVIPDSCPYEDRLVLTQRRGIAWAFSDGRANVAPCQALPCVP